ncbi:MAG: chorismate mutase [Candidatus Melainabacteria bacterium RIFCSPLOWO2_02_FULL_35_15]|nr:MAG: chorismate mutase [Candidatus Melainabacteria bacterium RIFCSPLOWO2_12_FULL_35_11]OGI13300.1 MAG: chorismate mutase [Candidatus Melainabacteria bacterium RIFCSPLOWO2_02_FULL_35_15]
MESIVSIRGAITVKENSIKEIKAATTKLLREIFTQNNIQGEKVINIIYTVTDDLDVLNPATVTREEFKIGSIPMLCVQEMKIKDGLSRCIRIMLQVYSNLKKEQIKHIYLGEAANLRPDLA